MESDVEKPTDMDAQDEESDQEEGSGWLSLFSFTTRIHLFSFSVALILSVASGIIIPAFAIILGKVFDLFTKYGAKQMSGSDLVKKVSIYALGLVGLGAGSGILNAGYFMAWLVFGELQAKGAREKLFDGMLKKDMDWYDMRKAGIDTLISRLQMQVRELQIATSQPLGFAVQHTITMLAAVGIAFYTAWNLTLVTLATVPFAAITLTWISARMQPSIDTQVDMLTQASKQAHDAISAIDTVKCFNGQDFEIWQYAKIVRRAARYYLVQAQANALQIGFVRFVTLSMFVQGFWYGSHLVATGAKNPGQVLTTFWACLMATQSIEQILPQMIVLEKGRAAGATLKSLLAQMEKEGKSVDVIDRKTPEYCEGDIEVRNVSFTYPSRPRQPALSHASFFFPTGETTFVVGRSGSGKSTLGNLLMRFYEPDSGDLLIDGNDINVLDINWLRNNVTLVQQQSVLFDETIFKNIAFGRKDHSKVRKEEVKQSIETALLQHTIRDLPLGLDTVVGANGSAMSGGQKQRVAIARARLRDTPILILDEATSALDHVSKTLVLEQIQEWRRGKTTIIITHDMSQIQENEYVYVLEQGAIVQEGFRYALEKANSGPFGTSLPSIISFPPRTPGQGQRKLPKRSDISVSPRTSIDSEDPFNFQFFPRSHFVPSVFGPPPEGPQARRPSQSITSPLGPVAFPVNRMSIMPSTFTSTVQKKSKAPQLLDDITSLPPSPTGQFFERERQNSRMSIANILNTDAFLAVTRRLSKGSLNLTRSKMITPRQKQLPTTAERARRVAPIQKILMTVWPTLTWRKRVVLVCGFFFAAIHAGATPAFSYLFSKLLATFFLPENRSKMALTWSLSVLGVALVDSIASFAMHYLLESCGQAWIDSLRIEALRRILDQPRAWFDKDKNDRSRLTACLDRNAEEMRNLIGRFAGFIFVAVTMMGLAIVWSLALCWKLTLVGLASAPVLYGLTRTFEAISGKWESKSNDVGEAANSIFTETFANIRVVRALTLEGYFHKKYLKAAFRALKVGLKRSALSGFFFGLSDCGIIFVTALIFYYGAVLASSGNYSVEDILTVFTMLLFSIANANAIVAFVPQLNSSRDTATRLLRLANLPYKQSHEHTGHVRLSGLGPVEFSDLSFSYPSRPSAPVLSSLSLSLNSNMTTALVGASGSGKSTITSLLLGLYSPTSGTLTYNFFPISALHLPTLRALVTMVPQNPTLISASIATNIAYALPENSPLASMQNIRAAATAAGIDDFISSLPHGYETPIGAGGTGLSGGQAQRIAVARAIARRPKLLVLDEATSGLDEESARGVRETVIRMGREGCGVLAVTHEPEMMRACDEVVVLKDGAMVERGRFEELVGRSGGELRRLVGG